MAVPTAGGSWGRLIPANREKRWPYYYKCMWGNKACKATTVAIRSLDDIRGHMVSNASIEDWFVSCKYCSYENEKTWTLEEPPTN
jgi:hypothetical protein